LEAQRTRRHPGLRALLPALILGVALPVGAEPQEVGFVESFSGSAEGYAIERGEARLPVFVLAPLHAGDRVHVDEAAGHIALRIGAGPARVVEMATSPFAVQQAETEDTLTRNVVRWLGNWAQGNDPGAEAGAVSLVTRGLELRAPLLGVETRIAAGTGPFALAWSGGAAPYSVRLEALDGAVLLAREVDVTRLPAEPLTLAPGALRLTIRDATGIDLERRIEVRDAAPEPPPGLIPAGIPDALGTVLEASWLAGVERGAWRLEAYRRASEAPADSAPARGLRDALEAGAAPPAE
jgi:hypothetical protein